MNTVLKMAPLGSGSAVLDFVTESCSAQSLSPASLLHDLTLFLERYPFSFCDYKLCEGRECMAATPTPKSPFVSSDWVT